MSFFRQLHNFWLATVEYFAVWVYRFPMLNQMVARMLYFPSILRMCLREGEARRWYDRIDDAIVLGALPFKSQTKELAEKHNVRAVISVNEAYELNFFTNSKEEWARSGITQFWFPTVDFRPPSLPYIWSGLGVIDAYKARRESVYVHCKAGKGRSTIVVACYLMKDYGLTPNSAVEFIKDRRPQININKRQMLRLCEFHEQLKSKKE